MAIPPMPKWLDKDDKPVSCTEKIKVMTQNMEELQQTAQDAFEDALLMGCQEEQIRAYLQTLMDSLDNPYQL
jgi:hypothetical protein